MHSELSLNYQKNCLTLSGKFPVICQAIHFDDDNNNKKEFNFHPNGRNNTTLQHCSGQRKCLADSFCLGPHKIIKLPKGF